MIQKEAVIANLIEVIISASDNASGVIKGITGALDGIGGSAIKVGAALTAATAPIAGFFATAIQQASDQETAFAQLNAVIKSTGGIAGVTAAAADSLSDSLSKVTRFSDDSILSAESMILTFGNIGSDIFPDVTRAVLDLSTAMGQDLKTSAIQIGKSLNDPIAGLSALRRVGVQFSDAQETLIKGMVTSGNLMGAQKAILSELSKEFGNSAVAAGRTMAGALDIVNHKFEDFQEKIGFLVMPTLEKVIDVAGRVIDRVTEWTERNPGLTRTIVAIGAALVAAGPILIGIGTAIKLVTAETGAFKIALTALSGPVGIVLAALAALVLAYQTNAFGLRDTLQPVLEQIGKGFKAVGDAVGLFVARLKEGGITEALGGVFSVFEDGSSTISTLLQSFGVLPSTAESVANALSKAFEVIKPGIKIAQDAVEYFVKGFTVNFNDLLFHAGYIFNAIRGALETAFTNIWTIIQPAVQPILDWLTGSGTDSLGGAVAGIPAFINDNIIAPLKGIWVLVQPEVEKITNWFNTDFLAAVQQVSGWIDTNIVTPLKTLWTTIQPTLAKIGEFLTGLFKPITDFIQGIFDQAADTFEMLKRIGNGGHAERTLIGESAPGVPGTPGVRGSQPGPDWKLTSAEQQGVDDWYAKMVALKAKASFKQLLDGLTSQDAAIRQTGVDLGASLITDAFLPTGNILFNGIGTLKQPAFLAGVGLGNGLITAVTPLGTQYMSGIASMTQASYNAGALVGQAIQNVASLLGGNFTSGVSSVQEAAFNAGAALGNLLKGVVTKVAQVAQQLPPVIETKGAGPGGLPAVTGTAAIHDYPGAYRANVPLMVGTGAQPELFIPSSSGYAVPNADRVSSGREPVAVTAVFPNVTDRTSAEEFHRMIDDYFIELKKSMSS